MKVLQKAGELVQLKKATREQKQYVYSQLIGYQRSKGYADGWTAHKYKEYFGVWPKDLDRHSAPIGGELKNWIVSRAIAFAKARDPVKHEKSRALIDQLTAATERDVAAGVIEATKGWKDEAKAM